MKIPLRRYWSLLGRYLRPQSRRVVALAVLLVASIALQLANPQILRTFIDTAMAGGTSQALVALGGVFIALALANQLVVVTATYVGENVGWTATNALRADLAAHCLRLDLSFHKAHTPGEIIERIDGDVTALSNFFSQLVIDVLSNVLLITGVLVLLFREDWRVGLSLSAFAAVALWALARVRSIAVPYWRAVREANAQFFGFIGEQLSGAEDLRANGATGYAMRLFHGHLRAWLPLRLRAWLTSSVMWTTTLLIFAAGNAVAFALGATLWNAGAMTLGTVYLLFYYTELLRAPLERIRTQLEDLQKADASIGRVAELFATQSRLRDGPGAPLPAGALAIDCARVSFSYDHDPLAIVRASAPGDSASHASAANVAVSGDNADGNRPDAGERVLHEISFRLAAGQVLGLLGRTGSGKTTLARLLLRLYDPTVGEICLGGVVAHTARLADLRRRVGMVTQDVQLFRATVRDNLTFFKRDIPDVEIVRVLEDLGLGAWLRGLPSGLDTPLEPGGGAGSGGLSAGEAQLLAFARVFLKDPGLVILDEASSRLDPATEQLIERAVSKLLSGRTGVIIAHRLGTVQRADDILILEGGRVLEYGARARLAADAQSRFSQLLQTGLAEVLA